MDDDYPPLDFPELEVEGVSPALRGAIIMGIEPTTSGKYLDVTEVQRILLYEKHIKPLFGSGDRDAYGDQDMDIADERQLAIFCLRYLGPLVEKCLSPPLTGQLWPTYPVWNPYSTFITSLLQQCPYGRKFFASQGHPAQTNKAFVITTAMRLLRMPQRLADDATQNSLADACHMLWLALVHVMDETYVLPLPPSTAEQLAHRVRLWTSHSNGGVVIPDSGGLVRNLIRLLEGRDMDSVFNMKLIMRSRGMCAKRGCEIMLGPDRDLYQCGRCQTALYCSRAHQRHHWNDPKRPHSAVCFATDY